MEKFFKLKENGTNVSTEIMAGITTFMTMAYILAVNPNILSASGMDRGAVFTATALSAFIATCLMALLSNYPFVLAPGMGLNAYFAYTVVLGMGYTWQAALAAKEEAVLKNKIEDAAGQAASVSAESQQQEDSENGDTVTTGQGRSGAQSKKGNPVAAALPSLGALLAAGAGVLYKIRSRRWVL